MPPETPSQRSEFDQLFQLVFEELGLYYGSNFYSTEGHMSITLEQDKAFSESMVWQISRDYYIEKGVSAWSESVPFYITSNSFIANQYADILLASMQSWVQENRPKEKVCFSLLEIGAGCGQLAYLIIKALNEKCEALHISGFSFRYIISDLSQKTLNFIADHPLFSTYVKSGQCRFSCFDLENDNSIDLISTGGHPAETLRVTTPLLLIANYLFDSLSSDVFYVNDGLIEEARVNLTTPKENLADGIPQNWQNVQLNFTREPIAESHYADPDFNTLLQHYKKSLDDTHIIFPSGSLKAIKRLREICQQPLLILLSDKCFNTTEEMVNQPAPELDVHGSFSTMVNLDALARYCKSQNGHPILPTPRDGLTTALLAFDLDPNTMPLLAYSVQQHLEAFSPTDFFNMYETLVDQHTQWSLSALVSALSLSQWDAGLFSVISDHLQDLLEESDSQVVDYLVKGLPQIASNFYPIPAAEDVTFQVGSMYYALDHYEEAITYYKQSLTHYPNEHETLFNLALCYACLDKTEEASQLIDQCIALKPKDKSYLNMRDELNEIINA